MENLSQKNPYSQQGPMRSLPAEYEKKIQDLILEECKMKNEKRFNAFFLKHLERQKMEKYKLAITREIEFFQNFTPKERRDSFLM